MKENIFKSKYNFMGQAILSIVLFFLMLVLFLFLTGETEKISAEEECKLLAESIERNVMQCYVLEGRYPDSIEYLEENYGVTYDKNVYRVDYIIYGSNMKPEIDIVVLGDKSE